MVSSIEFCSERKSDVIIGKPNAPMIDHICETFAFEKKDLLIVGDSYESDALAGINNDVDAVLIGCKYENTPSIEDISELPKYLAYFN